MSERPNVLLLVLDTARADHFGPFGGAAPTPAFDRLADEGRAERAFSTSPWTVPSHASMFTGLLPFDHGVTGAAAITPERGLATLRPAIERLTDRWLPEVFRRAGYRTAAISANVWITPTMGFDLGFERFASVGSARIAPRGADHHWRMRDLAPLSVRRRVKRAERYVRDARSGRDFGARPALATLRSFLAEVDPRPFFCFVNVMECHAPYLPPAATNPLSGRERLSGPAVVHRLSEERFVAAYNLGAAEASEDDLRILRALYAGEVAYADRFLAGLLDALAPLLHRTVLVVTSDHGEHLGEDHLLAHHLALDELLVTVPFVTAGLDAPRPPGRARSLASIPWTLAEAAGIEHPYPAPAGGPAIAQYEGGWRHLRRAPELERALRLTAERSEQLRAPASLATDGTAWLVRGPVGERSDGDAEALAAALDAAAAAPSPGGGLTAVEEAEIEERLTELGYL